MIHTQINSNLILNVHNNYDYHKDYSYTTKFKHDTGFYIKLDIQVTTTHKHGSAEHGARRVKDNVTYTKGCR